MLSTWIWYKLGCSSAFARFSKICKILQGFPTWRWAMTIQNPHSFSWNNAPQPCEYPTEHKAGQQLQYNKSQPFQRWKIPVPYCPTFLLHLFGCLCLSVWKMPPPQHLMGVRACETKIHDCNFVCSPVAKESLAKSLLFNCQPNPGLGLISINNCPEISCSKSQMQHGIAWKSTFLSLLAESKK